MKIPKRYRWMLGWVQLGESLVVVLTLGFVAPKWYSKAVLKVAKRLGRLEQK